VKKPLRDDKNKPISRSTPERATESKNKETAGKDAASKTAPKLAAREKEGENHDVTSCYIKPFRSRNEPVRNDKRTHFLFYSREGS